MASQLKIIGGQLRGMKLIAPPADTTRPLRARAKESLFDVLSDMVVGAACLDLFAGSGSIGLEAISRGSRGCVFVESNPRVYEILQKNVDKIRHRVDNDAVFLKPVMADVEEFLRTGPVYEAPFDIIFLDPPYVAKGSAVNCLRLLATHPGWVSREGLAVYQVRGELDFDESAWRIIDSRTFGESRLVFLGCDMD
jgi:16S rRNA (guanine966-N2)-methyltransferase